MSFFVRWLTFAHFSRSSFDLSTFLTNSWKNFRSPLRKRPDPSILGVVFVGTSYLLGCCSTISKSSAAVGDDDNNCNG